MALSGSYDFTQTRSQIIKSALRKVGAIGQGDNPTPEQTSEAADELNGMVKQWQAEGINLWSVEWITQTLTASSEVLGTDGNNYKCIRNHTSAAANKPITGADYTTYWKPEGSSGGAWADSTAYTSLNQYALDVNIIGIEEVFIRRNTSYYDTPLRVLSREEWMNLGTKFALGTPYMIWFHRLHTPEIFLYPFPDNTTDVVHLSVIRKTQDFDTASDSPDFTEEWISALVWNLAARLAFEYSLPADERRDLNSMAKEFKKLARLGTQETGPIYFTPDLRLR